MTPEELAKLTDTAAQMELLAWGNENEALNVLFGTQNHGCYYDDTYMAEIIINNYANRTNTMLSISFKKGTPIPGKLEDLIDESRHLYARHIYSLKSFDLSTKMCYLTNPWNSSTLIEVPLDDVLKN